MKILTSSIMCETHRQRGIQQRRETVPRNLSAWFCRCCRCSSLMSHIRQSMCSQSWSFLTCFLRKCRLKEPGVANETTLSRIGSAGFPRHKKHIVGLLSVLSVLTDEIAWLNAILTAECGWSAARTTEKVLPLGGRPRRPRPQG